MENDKSTSSIWFVMEMLYCSTFFDHLPCVEITFFQSLPFNIFYIWSDLFLDYSSYNNWIKLMLRVWVSFQSMGLNWIMLPIINSWSMLCHHLVQVRSACENEILLIYIIQQKVNSTCNLKVRFRNLSDLLGKDSFMNLPRFR